MSRSCLAIGVMLSVLAAVRPAPAVAASPLTADVLTVTLRPDRPEDDDYTNYVAALLGQGQIPRDLVESTFLWARRKPQHKFQYFKQALILRADQVGIKLPASITGTTGTIRGTVVRRIGIGPLHIEMPVSGAVVKIDGTRHQTQSDKDGHFSFDDIDFGAYNVTAEAHVLLAKRKGSARVLLPSRPPSDEPAVAFIVIK